MIKQRKTKKSVTLVKPKQKRQPRKQKVQSNAAIDSQENKTELIKTPLIEQETVLMRYGDENEIVIGTTHVKLIADLLKIKKPSLVYPTGYHQFKFNLKEYNLSFVPKRKRRKKIVEQE